MSYVTNPGLLYLHSNLIFKQKILRSYWPRLNPFCRSEYVGSKIGTWKSRVTWQVRGKAVSRPGIHHPSHGLVPVYGLLEIRSHSRRWAVSSDASPMYLQSLPIAQITTWAQENKLGFTVLHCGELYNFFHHVPDVIIMKIKYTINVMLEVIPKSSSLPIHGKSSSWN